MKENLVIKHLNDLIISEKSKIEVWEKDKSGTMEVSKRCISHSKSKIYGYQEAINAIKYLNKDIKEA